MARWIDATPDQRFWQYILPTAKRMINSGEWDACIAAYDPLIATARERIAAVDADSHDARRWTRRLTELESQRAGNVALRDADLAVIAEGVRRKDQRRGRAA